MSSCTRSVRFELRRNTSTEWDPNYVLLAGEPGTETDTGQMKVGDGVRTWGELSYVGAGGSGGGGSTGPTGPAGPVQSIGFDGGNSASVYSMGPVFDCGRAE
jgi:hypothetical protein